MQLRTLALLFSIVGLLYSGLVSALGLGEITLKSQYNQPLVADIRLLKVRDLSEEEILVELASRDDFLRAGVDREFFLTGLSFEVVLDNPANPYIRVTSRKPVTEPYLNFLIDVQWPSGRLLREYTLLLDLPVFSQAAPAETRVTAPTTSSTTTTTLSSPAPERTQASSPRPVNTGPAPVGRSESTPVATTTNSVDSYRVRSGDTLWEIAEKVRPDSSISVHQAMIALQQANPDAFVGGNINRLKNGRVLRVPSAEETRDISYNQAVSAVRQQTQEWRNTNTKAVLTSAAPTNSTPSSFSQPEGRLKLGAADSGQGDVRGAGASGSGESLQNELAITQEELSKSIRENSDLRARIAELEAQDTTREELIRLQSEQLKALQAAIEANKTGAAPEVGADANNLTGLTTEEATPATAADTTTPAASAETPETATESSADEPAPIAEAPVVAETPAPAEPSPVINTPAVEETSGFDILDFVKRNLIAVGGGLLALLVAILVLLRLREKPEEADSDHFEMAEDEDDFDDDDLDDFAAIDEDSVDLDEDEDIEAQTEDVVAEADIYISLGQEDKAIELLQKEIHQNPDNADARLGLLKIYAKAQNVSAFDEQYAQLLPLGNVYANDQAMALRKEIDDAEPFDTAQYSAQSESDDAFDSLNLDDDLDLGDDDNDDLDLALDLDDSELEPRNESVDTTLSLDEELDLDIDSELDDDLDLDLGDLSLDLDDMDDTLGDANLNVEDDEFDLELNLDEPEEESSALDTSAIDNIAEDLDQLDTDMPNLDDLQIGDELSGDDLTIGDLSIDDDELTIGDDEFSVDDDTGSELEFDLDFETADANLEALSSDSEPEQDDDFDLDAPPAEDIDLASLDEEIDAMTAELDEVLPLDKPESDQHEETTLAESATTEDASDSIDDMDMSEEFDLDSLSSDDDMDALASSEMDAGPTIDVDEADIASLEEAESTIESLDDLSVDELTGSDDSLSVSSATDDLTIESDEDLDFLEAADEVSTKLDLAKAYIDMGDREGAEDILAEVMEEGNDEQKSEAQSLMQIL